MKSLVLILILSIPFTLTGCLESGIKTIGSATGTSSNSVTYDWITGEWGGCSATACGTSGVQLRNVICRETSTGNTVADSNCASAGTKPITSQSCSASACGAKDCILPSTLGGGKLSSGQQITAFLASSVPNGQTCNSEKRTCNDGALSGSYLYSSCTVETPPPPDGSGIVIDLSYVNKSSSAYTKFKSYVDNKLNGGNPYGFSGVDAAYMYKLSGDAKYCTLAVTIADNQVSSAESRIASGSAPSIAGDSYLEVGEMAAEVAIAYDWCKANTTSAQRTRWSNYLTQAIYNVWNPNSAKWGGKTFTWSGWSITNPGNNYFYSFTRATMFWALASGDATLKTLAHNKFEMIHNYFKNVPGGGSLEGTGYGTSHMTLFDLYGIWRDSTGEDYANKNAHLTDSIYYWVHATTPNRDKFAPIGDQARVSQPEIFDYQRRVVIEARSATNSTAAKDIASWWLNHISLLSMSQGFNTRFDLLGSGSNTNAAPSEGLIYQAKGVGQLFARTGWDKNAMWLQFTAGKFNESHAHQDQGSFTLANSDWLAVTANVYSHSGINQMTDINNMVRFVDSGGKTIPQSQGHESTLVINSQNVSTGAINATANISPSYQNSNITSWTRNLDFANRKLTLTDNYVVSSGTQGIFQVNVPSSPVVNGNVVTAGGLTITVLAPSNPTISVISWKNSSIDTFNGGYKIEIKGPPGSGQYKVELKN